MNKTRLKNQVFNFLGNFGVDISTKFNNVCGKTGQYDVPSELFQKRTSRSNRILIAWQDVVNNNLSLDQLNTITGGVVVEFRNNDFFEEKNRCNPLFNSLVERLGSDETVSSIISIRSESGSTSSAVQRDCFDKLTNNLQVNYKGNTIVINKDNYKNFALTQLSSGGKGNEKWSGFLYVSIKGGQQDTIETHKGKKLTLFNPACEYANENVILDINLVLSYFALFSIDEETLNQKNLMDEYTTIKANLEATLKQIYYNLSDFSGSLYEYCSNHYSITICKETLYDPIQLEPIPITSFSNTSRSGDSLDLTHNEAVEKCKFYWDAERKCLLSPARPTNLFWSFHLSNMMQQNYTLDEYFEKEKERFFKRQELINNR